MNLGTILTILGLILTIAGLITLRPQLVVSPNEPLEHDQPFSVPFKVTNTGIAVIRDVRIMFYIHSVRAEHLTVKDLLVHNKLINDLDRGESRTLTCKLAKMGEFPKEADIAVVVDYKAWGVPFWPMRRVFRFTGIYGDAWQWLPQPSQDIRDAVDAAIDRNKGYLSN